MSALNQRSLPVEEWGRRVHDARRARRLSPDRLARSAAVSESLVLGIEDGVLCPADEVKARLARALHIATDELFPQLADAGRIVR